MQGGTCLDAGPDRVGGKDCAVASSSREHHLCAMVHCLDERFDAHLADDPLARIHAFGRQLRDAGHGPYLSCRQALLQIALFLLRVHQREGEAHPLLAGDFFNDLVRPGQVWIGSGASRVADQHRQPVGQPCLDDQRHVALHRRARVVEPPAPKVVGAHVRRTRVGANHVQPARHCSLQAVGVYAIADRAARADDADCPCPARRRHSAVT